MGFIILLILAGGLGFFFYQKRKTGTVVADNDHFAQAGVKVVFNTGQIMIKGKTYDVGQVTGIERERVTAVRTKVLIKVDDFQTPVHKIEIMGRGADDKFVQRLSAALRKAGGPSFY